MYHAVSVSTGIAITTTNGEMEVPSDDVIHAARTSAVIDGVFIVDRIILEGVTAHLLPLKMCLVGLV